MAMKWLEGVRYAVGKLKSTSRDKPLDITKLTVDEIMSCIMVLQIVGH